MRKPTGHPLLARLIDWTMAPLDAVRGKLVPHARGEVLEIGFGTGLNLPHYNFDQVRSLTAIEPDPHMRVRAEARVERLALPVTLVEGFAESLPFETATFDEVVMTFTLCTVKDPKAALAEIRRVLRPQGVLRFAEHTVSDHGATRAFQHAIDPVWAHFAGGCHVVRDAAHLIGEAGFSIDTLYGHGRRPFNPTPVHRGQALRT
ncbi:MAG: class I SAM-dependent methyltransferase [Myxococcota bacterium]